MLTAERDIGAQFKVIHNARRSDSIAGYSASTTALGF